MFWSSLETLLPDVCRLFPLKFSFELLSGCGGQSSSTHLRQTLDEWCSPTLPDTVFTSPVYSFRRYRSLLLDGLLAGSVSDSLGLGSYVTQTLSLVIPRGESRVLCTVSSIYHIQTGDRGTRSESSLGVYRP